VSRPVVDHADSARKDLGPNRQKPNWLAGRHALPFQDLSDDEFEVFTYLLLLRECPNDRIVYYGKTGDAGRDVIRTDAENTVELIQCKRYTTNVGLPDVREELAKLCTNVFKGIIPTPPDRVIFYAVPDLTAPAKDLLQNRHMWIAGCEKAIESHLGEKPSTDLLAFAKGWWPEFDHQDEHKLTERARKHQDLIEEFFLVRHVVTGSLDTIVPILAGIDQSVGAMLAMFEEVRGGPSPSQPQGSQSSVGNASPGAQALQVRTLSAKVGMLEERDRQHLDGEGQRLIAEIQGAVRSLDLREAAAAAPRLEAWLADAGRRASASVRGRTAILLADVAIIDQFESRGEQVDTTPARKWYARAADEFTTGSSPEDAARLAALEAKLLSLEGRSEQAIEIAAVAPGDPACLTARLSVIIDQGNHAEAVRAATGIPLHERWCDRLVIAHTALGDTDEAEAVVATAKRQFDQQTHRRCLLALAQGRLQRVLRVWPEFQKELPPAPPEEVVQSLRAALDDLRPLLAVAEANERVGNGLEAEALAVAIVSARLLGDRARASSLAVLLGTREPVHLEYARAALRGDTDPPADLPARLRRDYPVYFEAWLLAAYLSQADGTDARRAFSEGLGVLTLATSDSERERAVGVLLELASEAGDGALQEAEQAAGEALGREHRFTQFAQAARLLAAQKADEVAPLVEDLRNESDPLWRQFAAALCLLRKDEPGALEHLIAASWVLDRPEVLERTSILAARLDRDEAVEEILDRLVALRPRDVRAWSLLSNACVRLGRHGRAASAYAVLRELEPNALAHGVNHAKALAFSGRREDAVRVFDAVCARHPRSLEAFGGRAHLLNVLGRPEEALRSLASAREAYWSEPAFLLLYHSLSYRAGREDEGHLALARLLELQREGRDVPLRSFTLDELLDVFHTHRQAREDRNVDLLRGRIPWLAVGRAAGRPSLGDWSFRTQELPSQPDDPQERAEFSVYSTNGWAVRPAGESGRALRRIAWCAPQGSPVVADVSSLITLHRLGLLSRAASYFGRIFLPVSYAELALSEQAEYQPHQPSRLDAARSIRDAVDRGRIVALPEGDSTLPVLDEYVEGTTYCLRDIVAWLHETGHLSEARVGEAVSNLRDRRTDRNLPPVEDASRQGFRTKVMTLEAAIQAGVFDLLVTATTLSIAADEVRELRARIWDAEHNAQLAQEHHSLWAAVQGDERFELAEVGREATEVVDTRDRRLETFFDSLRLAEKRTLPLLADDRALQAVVINERPGDAFPAFGTDCLLLALADSGAVTDDELADAFLALVRRRYRFLRPPIRVLTTLAARYRTHPPGGPLRELSRYVHDCFRDPGLSADAEPTAPPVSVAWESYRHWLQHVARFVVHLWHDDRFDDRSARALTAWAIGELLPSPPASLPWMGAVVLCHMSAHHVVGTVYEELWKFRNPSRAAIVIEEVTKVLRLTRAKYLDIAGDFFELLSTQPAADGDPEEVREAYAFFAQTVLSPIQSVGPRVYFALSRLGVMSEPPAMPPPDELIAILDPAHERRIANPPGPIVLLRIVGTERGGEAVSVPDYLLHPVRTVRDTALIYLERVPKEPSSWLCPRSQAVLVETADAIRREAQAEWLPAARRLFDVLEEDFLLNLAGFRQCWAANLRQEQATYWERVIRPGIHLAASIPADWSDVPSAEATLAVAEKCVTDADSLASALDRYFGRYGHLPLAPPASAGSVVRRWASESGAEKSAWEGVWKWADAGASPLRTYHACQVFLECPDLVPENLSTAFWERVRTIDCHSRQEEAGEVDSELDLAEVGWECRRDLARHYLGQMQLHTADQPGDRLASLAWWAAERVACELAETLQAAGVDSAPALRNALDRMVSPEAELTDFARNVLRATSAPSTLAYGTMEVRGLWAFALLASPGPGVPLAPDDEPWIVLTLLGALFGGFPPPGISPDSYQIALGRAFDEVAVEWVPRIGSEATRKFLLELLEPRRALAESGSVLRLVRAAPGVETYRQAITCGAFRSLAALGLVAEDDTWNLLSDSAWMRDAATKLEVGPLEALFSGLIEVQRRIGGRWNWAIPHVFSSLAEDLDVSPERRRLLAFAAVRSAAVGGGMGKIRRLFSGHHREELGPLIDEWRDRFVLVRTLAPPLVAAHLRGITAGLSR